MSIIKVIATIRTRVASLHRHLADDVLLQKNFIDLDWFLRFERFCELRYLQT